MWQQFKKITKVGVITEAVERDETFVQMGEQLKQVIGQEYRGSIAIRMVDSGSCNGCELEIHALGNPFYDIEQYGVHFVASPRHADILLVTGAVSHHMETALLQTYQAMPEPKWVIAVGDCATGCGEYGESYALRGSVDKVLPVDIQITGCPPNPFDLMKGILALIESSDNRTAK